MTNTKLKHQTYGASPPTIDSRSGDPATDTIFAPIGAGNEFGFLGARRASGASDAKPATDASPEGGGTIRSLPSNLDVMAAESQPEVRSSRRMKRRPDLR